MNDIELFLSIRERLFKAIERALAEDGHCKSYEGVFRIQFPNYFEQRDGQEKFTIELGCYVVGPSRHYEWSGVTLRQALEKCERSIVEWTTGDSECKDGLDFCGIKTTQIVVTAKPILQQPQ